MKRMSLARLQNVYTFVFTYSKLIVDFAFKMCIIAGEHKPEIILQHASSLQKGSAHNVSPEIVHPTLSHPYYTLDYLLLF